MQTITLRIITGADRGKVYSDLRPPITLGREEGNVVQLNDERVSRFHTKIQEDDGRLVITDLDSTNGTRVNGHVCNLKILRYGDTISIGRSVLLVGTREQVAAWLNNDPKRAKSDRRGADSILPVNGDSFDLECSTGLVGASSSSSSKHMIPTIPRGLSPGQAAELRELLDYLHSGLRSIFDTAAVDEDQGRVIIDTRAWQGLLVTQSELSELIRKVEDPQGTSQPNLDTD